MLERSIHNKEQFLSLFYAPEIDSFEVSTKTKLSLYVLRIDGGKFDYEAMYEELGNASISYVFSRQKFDDIKSETYSKHVRQAQALFRKTDVNDGEGGELFLYCFLETHLDAPKILSKMELKTSSNDYVKGADGIHLLDLGDGNYHLIFGESKMIGDSSEKRSSFRKAIADAFKSIKKVEREGFSSEISLVDSNLMKESFSLETVDFLKGIIKPNARDVSVTKNNAFGIFVGFEVDINDWDLQSMTDDIFKQSIKNACKDMVIERYDYIKEQIEKENLEGYHFYIYAIPFIKKGDETIDKTRKKIIEKLK